MADRELLGRVLKAYTKRGGAGSKLGFPKTRPLKSGTSTVAKFEHGAIAVRKNGKVRVTYR